MDGATMTTSVTADLTPLVNAGAHAATTIAEQTLLGALAVLSLVVAVVCVWVVVRQARECSQSTKTSLDNNTKAIADLKDNNTQQAHSMQLMLVEFKSALESFKNR